MNRLKKLNQQQQEVAPVVEEKPKTKKGQTAKGAKEGGAKEGEKERPKKQAAKQWSKIFKHKRLFAFFSFKLKHFQP